MPAEPLIDQPPARHRRHGPELHAVSNDPQQNRGVTAPARRAGTSAADRTVELKRIRQRILDGDPQLTARQHERGKLTARERIELLVDPGSFTELQPFRAPSGSLRAGLHHECEVVAGTGTVHGRRIAVYATDFRVRGGSLSRIGASKIHRLLDLAVTLQIPVIALNDGAGARIQEGIASLDGYGGIFRRVVALSGVVPQLSVVLGPCAGGAVYSPALTDFIFMVAGIGSMYVTGPDVIQAVTGEAVTIEQLGGAHVHSQLSGVVSNVYDDEQECLDEVRYLLSFLPDNHYRGAETYACTDPVDRACPRLRDLVPASPTAWYNVLDVVTEIVDDGDFFEVGPSYARNLVCGFGRLAGAPVGIVANQPMMLAGALDSAASEKGARFVRFCDAFDIPLVTLIDVPGFLPGRDQEENGLIRRGAKLLFAYCEATVPRISVVLRKAYGGAYIVMDSKSVGADVTLAWPNNEIAVMGAEGAASILHRRQLAEAADPKLLLDALVEQYAEEHLHPLNAAEGGYIDDVIDPADTRSAVVRHLQLLTPKRATADPRKHSTIPL